MPQYITVEKYNPRWAEMYAAEAYSIRKILKTELTAIQHIGSTAVKFKNPRRRSLPRR